MLESILIYHIRQAISTLYATSFDKISLEKTNPDFKGDFTLVVFGLLKISKKKPEDTAIEIGNYLKSHCLEINSFNVVKGFLNIEISEAYWLKFFQSINGKKIIAISSSENTPIVMVEYSSPNTNKPLHLGHVRNNLLGYSVAKILEAAGNKVVKTNLVNDRGIHICKSMLAWQKWGNNETPESTGIKGDHLVGKYYVEFDKNYKIELANLKAKGLSDEDAVKNSILMKEAQEMLRQWEAGNKKVCTLWTTMNSWVYKGFESTYQMMGVNFDKTYYESNTYLLGKDIIDEGLAKGVLKRRADNSVFIDLSSDGLDEKTLLRSDGTALYMTQDLGTALQRFKESNFSKLIFTVGNEQDYHFHVLFLILTKLKYTWAAGLHHLSYGMVELPEGKMKSREGTVVDADDLMQEMIDNAAVITKELGKAEELSDKESDELSRIIGLGALKYFILKVDPKKKMLFNPAESIDFNGNTAPFIQFNYVRIKALLRKSTHEINLNSFSETIQILPKEKELIMKLYHFNQTLQQAASEFSPAIIANYVYELAKEYSQYYHDTPILKEENKDLILFRIHLSNTVGMAISEAMGLLGIAMPEKM